MKILHVMFSSKGGAAIGVQRLNEALLNNKIDSNIFIYLDYVDTLKLTKRISSKFKWYWKVLFKKIILKILAKRDNKETLSFNIFNNLNLNKIIDDRKIDIVHLHWIGNEMISVKEISKINKPVVWTLHDMWPFSGGDHFVINNNKFKQDKLKNYNFTKLNKFLLNHKIKHFHNKSFSITCPSKWIYEKVLQSSVFKNSSIKILPYIIDEKNWNYDLKSNKKIINSKKKTVILFSATSSVNFRKGFNFLVHAINNYLDEKKYYLLVVGDKPKKFEDIKIEKKYFGYVDSEDTLKNIYFSSDIFVVPSLFESFGQVFLEAGCFGLPSVTFNNTAASEIITHKRNGYLSEYKSAKDLANGIMWSNYQILNNKNFKSKNRDIVVKKFSYENNVKDYVNLYSKLT